MPSFHASDGALLAYDDRGPRGAMPLLFLHGWQGAATSWNLVRDALGPQHRTIALDLRGFGGSNGAPGPYTVDAFANDLSDVLAHLDLDPLVVVGHSMGAAVAQRFAIDRPEAVEGLVLVAPVPAGGVTFSPRIDAMFRATAGNPEKANAWLANLVYAEPPREVLAQLRAAAAAVSADVAIESFESWTKGSFEPEARTIATPTLVVAPAEDRPMTPEFARERVADVIAGSRFEIIADAGHYVTVDQPLRLAALIEDFVASL